MTKDDILNSVSVPILISTLSKMTFISFMTALHLHQLCRVVAKSWKRNSLDGQIEHHYAPSYCDVLNQYSFESK